MLDFNKMSKYMDYLHLTIPYSDFIKKYQGYNNQLENLIEEQNSSDVDSFKNQYEKLNTEITGFLTQSFNINPNDFITDYKKGLNEYRIGGAVALTIEKIKKHINQKLSVISYQLELFKACDLIISPSDNLYQKRQRFTIKQKRELILLQISKLKNQYYSIDDLYLGNGLIKNRDDESILIAEQLENIGYVDSVGQGNDAAIQITLEGIEYVQEYTEPSYGLYEFDEELTDDQKNNLKDILSDLREDIKKDINEEFKNQEEFIVIALNALFEVIDESSKVVDSKLPKKTIRQIIIGKVVEKGGDMALEGIMKSLLEKFKGKLMENPDFTDLLSGAAKFLNS